MTSVPILARLRRPGVPLAAGLLALLLSPASVLAQNLSGNFGDWIILADTTMSLALTTDSDSHALGIVCGPECFVYVENEEPCLEAHIYSARLEAGGDSYSAKMECKPSASGPLLVMPLEDRLLAMIEDEERLAIAIRRDDGTPSLIYFPLAGSGPAIHLAMAMRPYLLAADAEGLASVGAPGAASPLQ